MTDLVNINEDGVKAAADYVRVVCHSHTSEYLNHAQISRQLKFESYTPRTWRTHPLHLCPPEPYSATDPRTRTCLDWIFLISSLNFSFWSEREGFSDRYGVEWREGWGSDSTIVHTGYWSLVAAIDKGELTCMPVDVPLLMT